MQTASIRKLQASLTQLLKQEKKIEKKLRHPMCTISGANFAFAGKAWRALNEYHDLTVLSKKLKQYEGLISKPEKSFYLEKINHESSSHLKGYYQFTGTRSFIWKKIKI